MTVSAIMPATCCCSSSRSAPRTSSATRMRSAGSMATGSQPSPASTRRASRPARDAPPRGAVRRTLRGRGPAAARLRYGRGRRVSRRRGRRRQPPAGRPQRVAARERSRRALDAPSPEYERARVRTIEPHERLTPRSRRAEVRDPLPAEGRARVGLARRRRGAAALAAREPRPRVAGRVRADARVSRADRRRGQLGDRASAARDGRVGRRRRARSSRGQRLAAAAEPRRLRGASAAPRRWARRLAEPPRARDHREHTDDRSAQGELEPRTPARGGRVGRDRRLRHRPLLAPGARGLAGRRAQDRPQLRQRPRDQPQPPADRADDDRPREIARHADRRRGCRARGASRAPARARLRHDSGLPDWPAARFGHPEWLATHQASAILPAATDTASRRATPRRR